MEIFKVFFLPWPDGVKKKTMRHFRVPKFQYTDSESNQNLEVVFYTEINWIILILIFNWTCLPVFNV